MDPKSVECSRNSNYKQTNKNAMIPNEILQTVETNGVGVKLIAEIRFDADTIARAMHSLSSGIYNYKELAVIREYSNNAADANIENGKSVSEVIVTLPTYGDLTFKVRDFGKGLDVEDIKNIYSVLGRSTKRESNAYNGVLGYGAKSFQCISDSVTITSWHNGEKTIYQGVKGDNKNLPQIYELSRMACYEPTGIEISIPIPQSSMWTFHRNAADYFKYWETLPTFVNLEDSFKETMMKFRNTAPTLKGEGWDIRPKTGGSAKGVAFMGGVSYDIDWDVLNSRMSTNPVLRAVFNILNNNDVTFYFKMGEIGFTDSRESVEYTEATINALSSRVNEVVNKITGSIQDKFNTATNLWDAKIIYNAIFGTGVLELEKGEDAEVSDKIKILDGNLMTLETALKGKFFWNNIVLDGPTFTDINRFDNLTPDIINQDSYTPSSPVMTTFRRKKSRAKLNKCNREGNNKIVASPQSVVIWNDTGIKSNMAVVARYMIFKEDSRYRSVHIFNFDNAKTKDLFYNEYGFDKVPVINLSSLIWDAKKWNSYNKSSRSYSSGGGVRVMQYMDVGDGSVQELEVPIRSLEDGGIYINAGVGQRGRKSRLDEDDGKPVLSKDGRTYDSKKLVSHFNILADKLGMDMDRVYIIDKITSESKWFRQAVEAGDWTNVWDYIDDNMTIDVQPLINYLAYDNSWMGYSVASKLKPLIKNESSLMLEYANLIIDNKGEPNHSLINVLKTLGMWYDLVGDKKSTLNLTEIEIKVKSVYPLLSYLETYLKGVYMSEDRFKNLIQYVNAMDCYIDMAPASVENKVEEVLEVA